MRFIYTFDAVIVAMLLEKAYTMIYSNGSQQHPMWVFDNPSGTDPEIEGGLYALSDTINI